MARPKICVYPDPVHTNQKLYNLIGMLGLEQVGMKEKHDLRILYDYRVKFPYTDSCAVNGLLNDVGKDRVDRVFTDVFAYSSLIDPEKYYGICVRKGIGQCTKDGILLQCPTEKEDGFVYQKLIDNRIEPDKVQVFRVPVIGRAMPFVWITEKRTKYMFKDSWWRYNKQIFTLPPDMVFNKWDIHNMRVFCDQMKIDWAELDVLKDSDGRIYIVDVNNIPGNEIFDLVDYRIVQLYAETFKEQFL